MTIYVEKARVLGSPVLLKCGNVMSGFGSVVIAAKVIYCVIYRKCLQTNLRYVRLRILYVKHKNAS